MEKPVEPQQEDFGVTEAQVAAVNAGERRCEKATLYVGVPMTTVAVLAFAVKILTTVTDEHTGPFLLFYGGCLVVWTVYNATRVFIRACYRCPLPYWRKVQLYKQVHNEYETARKNYEHQQEEELRRKEAVLRRQKEDFWQSLTGEAFEIELAVLYRKLGYQTILTNTTNDRGIDIILKRDGQTKIVQCKRHNKPVGPAVARELYGAMISCEADGAILACTSGFTVGVHAFVYNKPIELVGMDEILEMQGKTNNDGLL